MNKKQIRDKKRHWNKFYKGFESSTPSQFCVSIIADLELGEVIVELGSGNGRDALFFASQGFTTVAIDLSKVAVTKCQKHLEAREIRQCLFIEGDITDKETVEKVVAEARVKAPTGTLVFYSRFVIHSLDDAQQGAFLRALYNCTNPGDVAYFEFRSTDDAVLEKHYGDHYRRYVDTNLFVQELIDLTNFYPIYSITGQGMARFKAEDPVVSRIIAQRR